MIYNKELLLEDINFPLKWDSKEYKMYIFDNGNNMIAQKDRELRELERLKNKYNV